MTSTTLTTIATFVSYNFDGSERRTGVRYASINITGKAGDWSYHVALLLNDYIFGDAPDGQGPGNSSGLYFRHLSERTYRTRELAKGGARSLVIDHLGEGFDFSNTRLSINGREKGTL